MAYLYRLRERMEKTGRHQGKLFHVVCEAHDAMLTLCMDLHYLSCGGGVYREPESAPHDDPSHSTTRSSDQTKRAAAGSTDTNVRRPLAPVAARHPGGILPWRGENPICLDRQSRYLVVVHAVWDGKCAPFDTDTRELIPFDRV